MKKGNKNTKSVNKRVLMAGGALATAFLFSANLSMAQERENVSNTEFDNFQQWDANADARLDMNEYNAGAAESGLYKNWLNKEGKFTQEDFNRGVFYRWDIDGDGSLSQEEYTKGNAAWAKSQGDNFASWDANQDALLDETEYAQGMNETGIYASWDADADGNLNESEFNQGVYSSWDANQDGILTREEYDAAESESWMSKSSMKQEMDEGEVEVEDADDQPEMDLQEGEDEQKPEMDEGEVEDGDDTPQDGQ